LARRLVPRFTRGIVVLLFYFSLLAAGGKDDQALRRPLPLHAPKTLLIVDC